MNHSTKALSRRGALAGLAAMLVASVLMSGTASAVTPEEIKAKGKLVVGIQAANPPWGFVDSATGNADGIDADIAKLYGKELGVPVQFVGLEVANRIPALTSGRVDVLFATMAMLPDRAKAVQYSKPYIANTIYLVAAKSTPIKTNADMGKIAIGVPRASTQDSDITKNAPAGTNILRFDNDAATIQALLSGQVQAVGANMTVRADPQQIEQVLINLLKNAAEALAGRKDGQVILRGARDDHGKVLIQVIDNGPGIDSAHLDDIFLPFFTTKRSGSGVGLSVSRQIMALNKGMLTVKTAPGAGNGLAGHNVGAEDRRNLGGLACRSTSSTQTSPAVR